MNARPGLSRKFLSFSLFLVVLTGLSLGFMARELVRAQLSQMAGSLNEDTARVLRNTHWNDISGMLNLGEGSARSASIESTRYTQLRQKLGQIMAGSEIVKVKLFDQQGICVFSTDLRQIGEIEPSNSGVAAALAGQVSSGFSHRGEFDALHAQITDVDLFHSYVPIREGRQIVGVFEVYQNVTHIQAVADRSLRGILLVIVGVLAMLLLLQYLVVRWLGGQLGAKDQALETRNTELAAALDEAHRANRVKSEFISTLSHELRTPLTAIHGTLGLMSGGAMGELSVSVRHMIGIAHKNCQRLGHLINDLLDMEKLLAGKLHFEMARQPLMPLIEQALEANLAYAEKYGVKFELRQRLDGALVEVDAQRLQQVLANLLSNAAKFSPTGAVVEVDVHGSDARVRVEVRDHGPGIPLTFRGRIFQKFSQADATDARQKGGTGLGLAISRELVDRLGGQLGFESVEGQGSCFFVELPLCEFPPAELPNTVPQDARPRILTVEDDIDMARMLGQMLSRAGYAVDLATTGNEALDLLARGDYAAVTMDLRLPDMSGQMLIRRLRVAPATASLPVMVISGCIEEGKAALGERIESIEWLAKPIDLPSLLASLNRLLAPGDHAHPRVLHVEDDAELHQIVRAMAGDRFDFELATTLREARARVALERFDVVILDLGLPNESGWDLLPEIRLQQPGTRVVVLTGKEMAAYDACRVDAVLKKSQVSPQQLLDAIHARLPKDTELEAAT